MAMFIPCALNNVVMVHLPTVIRLVQAIFQIHV